MTKHPPFRYFKTSLEAIRFAVDMMRTKVFSSNNLNWCHSLAQKILRITYAYFINLR